jgi:hypothetical protein
MRIESTIPKVPVIGLDYTRRDTSNLSRFDSLSSLTAIYSQISRPKVNKTSIDINSNGNSIQQIENNFNET